MDKSRLLIFMLLVIATVCALTFWFQEDQAITRESKVNHHLPHSYRVVTDWTVPHATSVPPLAKTLKERFAGVTHSARVRKGEKVFLKANGHSFLTSNYLYADPDFPIILNRESLIGLPLGQSYQENSIIITEEFSKKIFGKINTEGEKITLDDKEFVVENIVSSDGFSHLKFDFLLPMRSFSVPSFGSLDNWGWVTFYTYLKLEPSFPKEEIDAQLEDILKTEGSVRIAKALDMHLQPLEDIYYHERLFEDGEVIDKKMYGMLFGWRNNYLFLFFTGVLCVFLFFFKSLLTKKYIKVLLISPLLAFLLYGVFNAKQLSDEYKTDLEKLGYTTSNFVIQFDHEKLKTHYEDFKTEILGDSNVVEVGGANHIMEGLYGTYNMRRISASSSPGEYMEFNFYPVHNHFFRTMEIPMRSGMDFKKRGEKNDTLFGLIINEAAALKLGHINVLGDTFYIAGQGGMYGRVEGIVRDFHYEALTEPIKPLVNFFRRDAFDFVVVKIKGNKEELALKTIENTWTRFFPDIPLTIEKHSNRADFLLKEQKIIAHESKSHSEKCLLIGLVLMIAILVHKKEQK